MGHFVMGFCISGFWAVLLIPVFVVKSAFSVSLD